MFVTLLFHSLKSWLPQQLCFQETNCKLLYYWKLIKTYHTIVLSSLSTYLKLKEFFVNNIVTSIFEFLILKLKKKLLLLFKTAVEDGQPCQHTFAKIQRFFSDSKQTTRTKKVFFDSLHTLVVMRLQMFA